MLTPKERAKLHRDRKKMYLVNLEKENLELKKQVEELKIDNGKLKERIRRLENDKSTVASVPVRTEEKKELSNYEKLKVGDF